MDYKQEIFNAMTFLGQQSNTIFVGQNIAYPSNQMYHSLKGVPEEKKLEVPVAEDFQMGMTYGLALAGFVPITIYPRWDFLLLASNQMVNHLDKAPYLTKGRWEGPVIIRTMVGGKSPLDPGEQHTQDHTEAFRLILKSIRVVRLEKAEDVMATYLEAYHAKTPTLIVEK